MSAVEFLSRPAAVSMADEWFELATPDHFWIKWRHSVLLRELKRARFKGKNALEIGCGHGLLRNMVENDLQIPVDGCDLNRNALEMAVSGKGRLFIYDIFDRNPALLGAYDMVLLMDVLEHIEDDLSFLKVSLEHLAPGGLIVINVPAHRAFYSRYDEVAGHKRRYRKHDIESLFRRSGVTVIRTVEWGLFLLPFLAARKFILRLTPTERTIHVGFAPGNSVMHTVLQGLRRLEVDLPFPLPVGSSLLAIGTLK